ncbi:hypothetical protein EDB83DRAFT_2675304 [Lactarius deliciosus]|nr:hypothetical protein EDB83DRAFT_2675304 [Lactarius deliciosus]
MARHSQLDNDTLILIASQQMQKKSNPQMKSQKGSSVITPDPSILPANDLAIDPFHPVSATSPASRRRDNGVFAPTLVVHVASVAMCDVPSAALDKLATIFLDVRGREAEGKGGFVLALNKLASPLKHLPPMTVTLHSRSSVWYQRTDHLCYYTGALLRLLKVYKPSWRRRRSPYIFRSTFLGLVCVQCLLSAPRSVCLLDDIAVIVSWSPRAYEADEAGQYLTAYRQSECRTLTLIYEHLNEAPDVLLCTTLMGIPGANRMDAETLRASFGSSTKIARADTCLLVFGSSLLINGGARRCAIQALAQGEGVPTVGHELDKVAALSAKDRIVQRVVGQRHRACAGVKRQWD